MRGVVLLIQMIPVREGGRASEKIAAFNPFQAFTAVHCTRVPRRLSNKDSSAAAARASVLVSVYRARRAILLAIGHTRKEEQKKAEKK